MLNELLFSKIETTNILIKYSNVSKLFLNKCWVLR